MTFEFQKWPKTPRLNKPMVVTEKIDGTNGAIYVSDDGLTVGAQSRNRIVTPDDDNAGFARWVYDNAGALADTLGPGYHFGEWWGRGIQRGYGLQERRFSLFNTSRWQEADLGVDGLDVVPVLNTSQFSTEQVRQIADDLRAVGSVAAPGFGRPEGLIVYLPAANQTFKVLLENDDIPKGLVA